MRHTVASCSRPYDSRHTLIILPNPLPIPYPTESTHLLDPDLAPLVALVHLLVLTRHLLQSMSTFCNRPLLDRNLSTSNLFKRLRENSEHPLTPRVGLFSEPAQSFNAKELSRWG